MDKSFKNEFLAAYESHADAIYRYCFFRVYSKERAEEFAQETFLRAWEYSKGGKKIENMRALLYRIARNLIIDHSRKKKEESLETLSEETSFIEPSSDGRLVAEREMILKEVMEEMKNLGDEEREILTMRYVEDLDPKDIAEILGISANNVSVRINRAMKRLRESPRFRED